MKLFDRLKHIFNKYPLGPIIAIASITIGIYTGFFHQQSPEIIYEILTNTDIIDMKEEISKIEVFYDGQNITKENQTLNLISIKIRNDGNKNVLITEYDPSNPLGIYIDKGEIIDNPSIINASSDYLKYNVNISIVSPQKITFSKVIFEEKESFTVKMLVLSDKGNIPEIYPMGKIAGVKDINIIQTYEDNNENNPFSKNTLTVSMVFIIFLVIIYITISFSESYSKKIRKKIYDTFVSENNKKSLEKYNKMLSLYIEHGEYFLIKILQIIESIKKGNSLENILKGNFIKNKSILKKSLMRNRSSSIIYKIITELIELNIIRENNNQIILIDEQFEDYLLDFISFVYDYKTQKNSN